MSFFISPSIHSLLQRIFPIQGLNPGFLHCKLILYCLSHQSNTKVKVTVLVIQSCPTSCNPMDYSLPGSSVMEFSREEYWSGQLFPSLEDLPDQAQYPGLSHFRQFLYHLSHQGSPDYTLQKEVTIHSSKRVWCYTPSF